VDVPVGAQMETGDKNVFLSSSQVFTLSELHGTFQHLIPWQFYLTFGSACQHFLINSPKLAGQLLGMVSL